MNESQMHHLVAAAQPRYNERLPYHGWNHALAVMLSLDALCSRMEKRGRRLPRNQLVAAAAWHDVRYGGEYIERGFDSEESYAAHLAVKYAREHGIEERDIAIIEESILATRHNATRRTLPGLALHRADVDNIGGPYEEFLVANTQLWQEAKVLGKPISWEKHKENTARFVTFTANEMRRDLPRLHEHVGTPQSFDTIALQNLERYAGEEEPLAA